LRQVEGGADLGLETVDGHLVDARDQGLQRPVEPRRRIRLACLRLEQLRVRRQPAAEVFEAVLTRPTIFVEIAALLEVGFVGTEGARDERAIDRFDQHVQPRVGAVHEQPDVHLSRRGQPQARKQLHREPLAHGGRVGEGIVEHQRLEPEELLIVQIPVDVNAQAGLRAVAGAPAPGADSDVASRHAVPAQVRRVVGVLVGPRAQVVPVAFSDGQLDIVQPRVVEQVVLCLRRRGARHEQ
jgi:hypothetical protein